jgi:hypothetical protein
MILSLVIDFVQKVANIALKNWEENKVEIVRRLNNSFSSWWKNQTITKIDWYIAISIFFVCFLTIANNDIILIFKHGVVMDEAIIKGKLFHYYEYALDNISYIGGAPVYSVIAQILIGILAIPIAVIKNRFQLDATQYIGGIIYIKLCMSVIAWLCAIHIYRIVLKISDSTRAKIATWLFITSFPVIIGKGLNTDLLVLLFILLMTEAVIAA